MSSQVKIQLVYEGKFEGLQEYIETSINKNQYKLGPEGILFVGVICNINGEKHQADYTQSRLRPLKADTKNESWLTGFRLSYILQTLTEMKNEDYCKVGIVITKLNI